MSKKLLLDQGVPRSTVTHLAAAGVTADHVGGLGYYDATDEAILDLARLRDAIVVTFDADFHALLAMSGATTPSVVRLRVEGLKGEGVATLLLKVLAAVGPELGAGAVASVTETQVKVRRLPLVP